MKQKLEFLIIDPQNDFCDPKGSLFVPGADKDAERLAALLSRLIGKIEDIHVTMDSHHYVDIAHPVFWKDSSGKHPEPFTQISVADVENGIFRTTHVPWQKRALEYVKELRVNNRYKLTIWPPHCLIGAPGHNIVKPVSEVLAKWEKGFAMVDYVTKGSNLWTEHYSAVQADVPDPQDNSTMLNTKLIETLQSADIIAVSGQASSHCVANTITDIANNFGDENLEKIVLLLDTMSPVPGFEDDATNFIKNMVSHGIKTVEDSTNFLS